MGHRSALGLFLCLVLLAMVPTLVGEAPYYLDLAIQVSLSIVLAASYRLILNSCGLSFGHAGLMAVGAYTSALLATRLGMSFWLALPLAVIVGVIVAGVIGYLTLRLKGLYFGMVTFAFAEITIVVLKNFASDLFGGLGGILHIARPETIAIGSLVAFDFTSRSTFYYLAAVVMLVSLLLLYRLDASRLGWVFSAMREDADLAQSIGVNLAIYRTLAFCTGSAFAAIVGSMRAHYYGAINPADFDVMLVVTILGFVVIGGRWNFAGTIVGTIIMTAIGVALRESPLYAPLLNSLILILVVRFVPGGIVGLAQSVLVRTAKVDLFPAVAGSKH